MNKALHVPADELNNKEKVSAYSFELRHLVARRKPLCHSRNVIKAERAFRFSTSNMPLDCK